MNDWVNLLQKCIETFNDEIDETKLAIYGASHGGFLTCSIISHPGWNEKFKAACAWNPVTTFFANVSSLINKRNDISMYQTI